MIFIYELIKVGFINFYYLKNIYNSYYGIEYLTQSSLKFIYIYIYIYLRRSLKFINIYIHIYIYKHIIPCIVCTQLEYHSYVWTWVIYFRAKLVFFIIVWFIYSLLSSIKSGEWRFFFGHGKVSPTHMAYSKVIWLV